jgi:hypothetical protein
MHRITHTIDPLLTASSVTIVSRSFGHTRTETVEVVSAWDKPHVFGDSHPRERQVNLADGTCLRQGDRWGTPIVTRWRGGSPQNRIIRIESA